LRNNEYKWPRDPLHTWSRCWEYPYIYHHLSKWRKSWNDQKAPTIIDVGSGVTFFSFTIARLGCRVSCCDIDPVCKDDLKTASKVISYSPGSIEFRLVHGTTLPYADAEADLVYCISVLEHIHEFKRTVDEMARILKPGGLLLLTIDLDLRGDSEIGVDRYRQLKVTLEEHFDYYHLPITIHPTDLLTSANGPYPILEPRGLHRIYFLFNRQLKLIFTNKKVPLLRFYLCVEGMAMIRKQKKSSI